MAVRFKIVNEGIWVVTGPSQGDGHWEDYHTLVPIRDWEFFPEQVNSSYTPGEQVPKVKIEVQFPALSEWKDRNYDNVVYDLEVLYQGTISNWLGFQAKDLVVNHFSGVNPERTTLELIYQNLASLTKGIHTASVIVKAYEKRGSERIFIENSKPVKITLNVKEGALSNGNFTPRHITFNKSTGAFSGDLPIEIDDTSFNGARWISTFSTILRQEGGKSIITFETNNDTIDFINFQPLGIYQIELELLKDGVYYRGIPIILNVIDGQKVSDFSLSPSVFEFVISKNTKDKKTGHVKILNPDSMPLTLGASPSFLENIQLRAGELTFETKTGDYLALGQYSGEIVVLSGSIEKRVQVSLKVIRNIESDFGQSAYYFALDPNKIKLNKTNPKASYASMILEMYYQGYGEEHRERQEYVMHYFDDEITFYPGEEVQDFFIRCKELKFTEILQYQYSMAVVNITIKEYDAEDNELSEGRLGHLFFVPGKKPKAFPFFTDFPKRRTFLGSKIRLNTDALSQKVLVDELFNAYTKSIPSFSRRFEVCSLDLEKRLFHSPQSLISVGEMTFIPFPEPPAGKVIHIFFENQNLVLEWFSCTGNYQRKFDFTHITDENNGAKFGALETETLVLHTGWILREEIELINALIKSSFCFIIMDGEIIKARAMSKKNEIFNTEENLYSMDLEFNIRQNER